MATVTVKTIQKLKFKLLSPPIIWSRPSPIWLTYFWTD